MIRRRLAHALAALAVTAVAVLLPAAPASAVPKLCTPAEWIDPRNFKDCADGIGDSALARLRCLNPPSPDTPTAGLPGMIASRPDSSLRPGIGGMWSEYGAAGYPIQLYDTGMPGLPECGNAVVNPAANGGNALAEFLFGMAAAMVGASNGLREWAYQPGSLSQQLGLDAAVEEIVQQSYKWLFNPFGAIMVAFTGLYLIWRAHRGRLSDSLSMAGWAVLVVVGTTVLAAWPIKATHAANAVGETGLAAIHMVVGPRPEHLDPEDCPLYTLNPDACRDHRPAHVRASDTAVDAVLYKPWLRAMLGDDDSATARKYGPALHNASALTWGEAATLEQACAPKPDPTNPSVSRIDTEGCTSLRTVMIDAKRQQWMRIAEQIKKEDPQAYEHLRGLDGASRMGAGFLAIGSAAAYVGFDALASAIIIIGFLVFLFAVAIFPLLATIGVFRPAAGGIRTIGNAVVVAFLNIFVFGFSAGAFLLTAQLVLDAPIAGLFKVVILALVAVIAFFCTRPVRAAMLQFSRYPGMETLANQTWRRFGASRAAGDNTWAAATADQGPTGPAGPTAPPPPPRRPEASAAGTPPPTVTVSWGQPHRRPPTRPTTPPSPPVRQRAALTSGPSTTRSTR